MLPCASVCVIFASADARQHHEILGCRPGYVGTGLCVGCWKEEVLADTGHWTALNLRVCCCRERASGMYRLSAFFFARMASDLPMDFAGAQSMRPAPCFATASVVFAERLVVAVKACWYGQQDPSWQHHVHHAVFHACQAVWRLIDPEFHYDWQVDWMCIMQCPQSSSR